VVFLAQLSSESRELLEGREAAFSDLLFSDRVGDLNALQASRCLLDAANENRQKHTKFATKPTIERR